MMAQRHGHIRNTTQRKAGQTMNEMDRSALGKVLGRFDCWLIDLLHVVVDLVWGNRMTLLTVLCITNLCKEMHNEFEIQETLNPSNKEF